MPDSALQHYLAERDVACPNCAYNLRDLGGSVCPECGLELRLTVGLVEPRMAAWVAGLVGLAAGTGFFGIFLVTAVITGTLGQGGYLVRFALLLGVPAAVHGAALWAWLRWRPWLRSRPRRQRIGLGAGAILLPVVAVAVLIILVRV